MLPRCHHRPPRTWLEAIKGLGHCCWHNMLMPQNPLGAAQPGLWQSGACCLLLLLLLPKCVAHPWTLKGGVKPAWGKPSSVIKTQTRTELGPNLA